MAFYVAIKGPDYHNCFVLVVDYIYLWFSAYFPH